jgi:cell division protein FtsB
MNTKQPPALLEELDRMVEGGWATDSEVKAAAELRRLHNVKLAFDEWIDKTSWVQHTAGAQDLGKHRADVLRERIERLEAENEALRSVAKELVVIVKELCVCYNHPLPEATLARAGEVK